MFVLQELYKHHLLIENQICAGSRVSLVESRSYNVLGLLLLSSLLLGFVPEAFDLVELKKVFLLHLFNTRENQKYVTPIPPSHTFDPDGSKINFKAMADSMCAKIWMSAAFRMRNS